LEEAAAAYERRSAAGKKRHQKPSNAPALHQQSQPQSQKEDGGGDARAREAAPKSGLISNEAMALADDLAVIAGHDPAFLPPAWCGAAMRVQAWLSTGWTRDVILIGAKAAMSSKRDGPPGTVNYFEKPIARVQAQKLAPIATGSTGGVNGKPGSVIEAADRLLERVRAFDQPCPDGQPAGLRGGAGPPPVRLVSKG
jgi:hypothetical protein